MEQWTDKAIKQHIEELIEESYLLALPESEVRDYIRCFVQSCESVLRENISVHGDIRITKVKLALLRSYLLIDENTTPLRKLKIPKHETSSRNEFLVQQVVSIKRTILKLLNMINPTLTRAVIDENTGRNEAARRKLRRRDSVRKFIITSGYYVLLFIAGILQFL